MCVQGVCGCQGGVRGGGGLHAWLWGGAGACVVGRGHAWLPGGLVDRGHVWLGACMVVGGICGCGGACMAGGHAWAMCVGGNVCPGLCDWEGCPGGCVPLDPEPNTPL